MILECNFFGIHFLEYILSNHIESRCRDGSPLFL